LDVRRFNMAGRALDASGLLYPLICIRPEQVFAIRIDQLFEVDICQREPSMEGGHHPRSKGQLPDAVMEDCLKQPEKSLILVDNIRDD
jgi:hypothetical protein